MQDIHRVEFPLPLAFGARGGPSRLTEISTSVSGHEQRNAPHSLSRRRYDVGAGLKSTADLETLITFFEARMGQLYGFLFLDPLDHLSCKCDEDPAATDQDLGLGDGERTQFLLVKSYADSAATTLRPIAFPDEDSLLVAVDGAPVTATYNQQTACVVLSDAPAEGAVVTAGYRFFTPVRFDMAGLEISLEAFGAGQVISIPLVEVLPHG